MIGPVMAADIVPGDQIIEHDWHLRVSQVFEGDWTDRAGRHHGMVVITRELGPAFPQHFALAQPVLVERGL